MNNPPLPQRSRKCVLFFVLTPRSFLSHPHALLYSFFITCFSLSLSLSLSHKLHFSFLISFSSSFLSFLFSLLFYFLLCKRYTAQFLFIYIFVICMFIYLYLWTFFLLSLSSICFLNLFKECLHCRFVIFFFFFARSVIGIKLFS